MTLFLKPAPWLLGPLEASLHLGPGGTFKSPLPLYEVRNKIAVIPVLGILKKRAHPLEAFLNVTTYDSIRFALEKSLKDPEVKGIVFEIDSPGGEVAGVFELSDFVYKARQEKPLVARIDDRAFSAAYLLASAASQIYASPWASVGSIGVIAQHVDQSQKDKNDGYQVTTLYKGARKNDGNPHEPLSESAKARLDQDLETIYEAFLEKVALYREVSPDSLRATEAGVFYGCDALKLGLIDHVMDANDPQNFFPKLMNQPQEEMMTTKTRSNPETMIQKPALQEASTEKENSKTPLKAPLLEEKAEDPSLKKDPSPPTYPHALEVARLCELSGSLNRLPEFLEKNLTPQEVQSRLLKDMERRRTIDGTFLGSQGESPLIKEVKRRLDL